MEIYLFTCPMSYEHAYLLFSVQDENYSRWLTEEYSSSSSGDVDSNTRLTDDTIATTWKDGPYLLVVKITSNKPETNWNLTGQLKGYGH